MRFACKRDDLAGGADVAAATHFTTAGSLRRGP